MEATGFYGVHLANYLSACDLHAPFSVRVYCLNPKEVKNYKKSFNHIGKNDGLDSYVIADFARVGRIAVKPWRGSQYLALQRLTRHRMHITECIAREKNYMLNNIYLNFSEYALLRDGQHPFPNLRTEGQTMVPWAKPGSSSGTPRPSWDTRSLLLCIS